MTLRCQMSGSGETIRCMDLNRENYLERCLKRWTHEPASQPTWFDSPATGHHGSNKGAPRVHHGALSVRAAQERRNRPGQRTHLKAVCASRGDPHGARASANGIEQARLEADAELGEPPRV